MTHGHKQGLTVRVGIGMGIGGQRGENWDNYNRITIKLKKDYWTSFLKDFIYLFLDRREGREKERERNINVWLPLT